MTQVVASQADLSIGNLLILGLGVIGGSIAKAVDAARQAKVFSSTKIFGYAQSQDVSAAIGAGVIDGGYSNLKDLPHAIKDADWIVFALPVSAATEVLPLIAEHIKPGAVLTDVCSVKAEFSRQVIAALGEKSNQFVAAHPIAGSHLSGFAGSTAELFRGATIVVDAESRGQLNQVSQFWSMLGGRVELLSNTAHDELYALLSHLPHVAAFSLVSLVSRRYGAEAAEKILPFVGRGFRDTTRVAASSSKLWADISLANREQLTVCISELQQELETVKQTLVASQDGRIRLDEIWQGASYLRKRLN